MEDQSLQLLFKTDSPPEQIFQRIIQWIQSNSKRPNPQIPECLKTFSYPNSGFYGLLNATFWSTSVELMNKYFDKCRQWASQIPGKTIKSVTDPILNDLLSIVNAYKIITNPKQKEDYLNILRIRAIGSQPLTLNQALNQNRGMIYSFILFSVVFQTNEADKVSKKNVRILEINFISEVINKKYKDRSKGNIQFSGIERVVKGIRPDEIILELNNNTSLDIILIFPTQREFLFHLLVMAQARTHHRIEKMSVINSPPNHNFTDVEFTAEREEAVELDLIQSDYILPTRIVLQDTIYKKCNTPFMELTRWITLGTTQILISKDAALKRLVNFIPLINGQVFVTQGQGTEKDILMIRNYFRTYSLRFKNMAHTGEWVKEINKMFISQTEPKYKLYKDIRSQEMSDNYKLKKLEEVNEQIEKVMIKLKELVKEQRMLQRDLGVNGSPELGQGGSTPPSNKYSRMLVGLSTPERSRVNSIVNKAHSGVAKFEYSPPILYSNPSSKKKTLSVTSHEYIRDKTPEDINANRSKSEEVSPELFDIQKPSRHKSRTMAGTYSGNFSGFKKE